MPNNTAYTVPRHVPRFMNYRELTLELIDVNTPGATSALFRGYPSSEDVDIMKYMDTIPTDYYFHYLFTCIYGLSAQDVTVRLEIDDKNQATVLYVMVACVQSDDLLNTLRTQVPLFVQAFGRVNNRLYHTVRPFCLNNLNDGATGTKSTIPVRGTFECSLYGINGVSSCQKYMTSYGIAFNLNIANMGDIHEKFPKYSIITHEEMYHDYIEPVIQECEKFLNKQLDPLGFMKIHWKRVYMDDSCGIAVSTVSLKVVLMADQINGIEIYELSNTKMVFRSVNPGHTFGDMSSIDWMDAAPYIQQIATALISDNGTLFIPEITSIDTVYHDNKIWIQVFMTPHFGHFTRKQIFYGNGDIVSKYGNEYLWLNAQMGSFIQFIFPTMSEIPDPAVLCYGRVMKDFLEKNLDQVAAALTCKEIRMRIISECDNWVYFALIDLTVMHELETFLHFQEYFLAEINSKEERPVEEVLNTIIGAFCASNPDTLMESVNPELWAKAMEVSHNDELVAIIAFWESSVHMDKRSFWGKYLKVREDIFNSIRASNDKAMKDTAIRSDERDIISPRSKTLTTFKFMYPSDTEKPITKKPGLLPKLFGKK